MKALYLFFVWLHVSSAIVWIGGMLFLVLVLVPIIRRREYHNIAAELVQRTGVRFRWIGWFFLGLLVLSGGFLLSYRGHGWQGPLGHVLGTKLALVLVILVLSALHDFVIGPRAHRQWQADPDSPQTLRLRRQAGWIGRVNLLLALIVVALGVMLVRGTP